ncbi:hypothetical protein VNO78_02913 [Psophocarpus tetragonolobus]|uniref:Uncharacterized protein n=1 Tax=Psophocarpus tetragonolobus TaxID=3891 RepID=A0AAN9XWG5_PSOTE
MLLNPIPLVLLPLIPLEFKLQVMNIRKAHYFKIAIIVLEQNYLGDAYFYFSANQFTNVKWILFWILLKVRKIPARNFGVVQTG